MAGFNEKPYEMNEVGWWSLWTEATWPSRDAYVLSSKDFDEYFFNRAGFTRVPTNAGKIMDGVEDEFRKRGRTPYIFLQSNSSHSSMLSALAERGYRISDQMSVMEMEAPSLKVNPELDIEIGVDGKLEEWVRLYVKAFYGDMRYLEPTLGIIRKVSEMKDVSLVMAGLDGRSAGCLALYRSGGMCGVYCVGTHPSLRNKGVASTMLDFSRKVAVSEGRRLVLQTILSESVERFYLKLGFRRVYLKDLFVKDVGSLR